MSHVSHPPAGQPHALGAPRATRLQAAAAAQHHSGVHAPTASHVNGATMGVGAGPPFQVAAPPALDTALDGAPVASGSRAPGPGRGGLGKGVTPVGDGSELRAALWFCGCAASGPLPHFTCGKSTRVPRTPLTTTRKPLSLSCSSQAGVVTARPRAPRSPSRPPRSSSRSSSGACLPIGQ